MPFENQPSRNHSFSLKVPNGDNRERHVCDNCEFVYYENPKIVVGSVVIWKDEPGAEDQFLLCRRSINPRRGYWTIPAGFMEQNETTEEGAMREAREEACADIEIRALLAVYNIPRISQVQMMHVARLREKKFSAGEESLEVGLFTWDEIPWDDIAFPSVHWALGHYREIRDREVFAPFTNPEGTEKLVR
ncbi:NUDIX domain-containing protein [Emcibacter sp.]|uniref:NUDIX hydrolase n=1 Tax=Emcibacter sp. TaxID=1979954 RepID=UPI003A91CB48